MIMIAPYVIVFLVFVLYPICYGLLLARHPASYVRAGRRPDLRAIGGQHARVRDRRHQLSR